MIRVALALVVGGLCTAGAWFALDAVERGAQQEMFDEHVARVEAVARLRATAIEDAVESLALFAELRPVEGASYTPKLAAHAKENKAFRAMAWMPYITDRPAFEAQMSALAPGFQITERTPEGTLQTAGDAQGWVPFLLVQPKVNNEGLMGMDIGNQGVLAQAMDRSAKQNGVAAAAPQTYPGSDEPAVLLLRYVPEPHGFIGALLPPQALFEALLEDRPLGLVGRFTDQPTGVVYADEEGYDPARERTFMISMGGRAFVVGVSPSPTYAPITIEGRQGTLVGGAGLTLLLVAFVLLGAPRDSR